ncbi:zinc metalloprotease [Sphaerisporangium siamense]|uniref:Aminopeptidase N n=1 Tax=Sphaerisporangium siamense TaxID=795645 RepID=A0A7W7D1K3_9ACTN|nr:M1 family metallopeptidase [Sphaerisporangium siamense]MBB4698547.1 aminopeptidase N [Sphaerisporangium siamense]GII85392.1 zinc metalloprotease [Sphaerisporangium siamense]
MFSIRISRTSAVRAAAAVAVTAMVSSTVGCGGSTPAATRSPTAEPGAQSAGDPLFAYLGNGGYDVGSYDVRYDYRSGRTKMNASVRIEAVATQALSSFSLDAAVERIDAVTVAGRRAAFRVSGEKLLVTPEQVLPQGRSFRVEVSFRVDRSANPQSPAFPPGEEPHRTAWVGKDDGFAVLGQPDRAHMFFPSNDHPSAKAKVTFRITVPRGLQAVANGTLRSREEKAGRVTYTFTTRDPIPTHVVQAAVGRFTLIKGTGPGGMPLRSYVATGQAAKTRRLVDGIPAQMAWLEKHLGPYPFETYGVLGVPGDYNGVALETATISTHAVQSLTGTDPEGRVTKEAMQDDAITMMHELAHQYFGDAVAVRDWNQMWISEGHAEFYQVLYAVEKGYRDLDDPGRGLRARYEFDGEKRVESGPPGNMKHARDVLVGTNTAGLLMLFGLRELVGEATFQRIEKSFFSEFKGRSAGTEDYIKVANRVSGKDLTGYINSWIYDTTTPRMPGHPDWKPTR